MLLWVLFSQNNLLEDEIPELIKTRTISYTSLLLKCQQSVLDVVLLQYISAGFIMPKYISFNHIWFQTDNATGPKGEGSLSILRHEKWCCRKEFSISRTSMPAASTWPKPDRKSYHLCVLFDGWTELQYPFPKQEKMLPKLTALPICLEWGEER